MKKLFLLIVGFHLLTLNYPLWTYDDGCAVDFALHGHLSTWLKILPHPSAYVINVYGLWDSWVFFFDMVRSSLQWFGIGYWQLRIFPFLIHATALFLLGRLTRSWAIPFYMAGTYFFTVSHGARPESMILLLMVANLYWHVRETDKAFSFHTGSITAFGLGFHSNALFIALMIPALVLSGKREPNRILYWGLGFLGGFLVYLPFLPDVGNIVNYFQLEGGRVGVSQVPFLHPMFVRTIEEMNSRFSIFTHYFSFFQPSMVALELFSVIFLLRRFKHLDILWRSVVVYAVGLFICLSFFSPHFQPKYLALLHPWCYISIFLTMRIILRRIFEPDLFDVIAFILCHAASFWTFIQRNIYVFAHASDYLKRLEGHKIVFVVIAVAVILAIRNRHLVTWPPMGVYFVAVLSLFFLKESTDLIRSFSESGLKTIYRNELKTLTNEKLVAPNFFGVLEPSLSLQCPIALRQAARTLPGFDPVSALFDYHPTTVFWPEDLPSLKQEARKRHIEIEEKELWETPLGNFRKVKFRPS